MPELVIQGLPAGLVQEVGAGPRPTLGTCCMDEYPRCLGAEPYFMKRSLLSKPQVVVKAVLLVVEPNAKSGLHGLLLISIRSVSIEGQVPGPRSQVPGPRSWVPSAICPPAPLGVLLDTCSGSKRFILRTFAYKIPEGEKEM